MMKRIFFFVCLVVALFIYSQYIFITQIIIDSLNNQFPFNRTQIIILIISIYHLSFILIWAYLRILLTPAGFAIQHFKPTIQPTTRQQQEQEFQPSIQNNPINHTNTESDHSSINLTSSHQINPIHSSINTNNTNLTHNHQTISKLTTLVSPLATQDSNLTRVESNSSPPLQSISPELIHHSNINPHHHQSISHHQSHLHPNLTIPHVHLSPPSPSILNKTEPDLTDNTHSNTFHEKINKQKLTISQVLKSHTKLNQFLIQEFTNHLDSQFLNLSPNQLNQQHHNDNVFTPTPKYCKICRILKPPRVHHCRICNTCVLKMDHHCPWVGRCIGAHNYKFFMNFLQLCTLYCVTLFVILVIKANESNQRRRRYLNDNNDININDIGRRNFFSEEGLMQIYIIIGFLAIFTSFLMPLLFNHFFLIFHNATTLEQMSNRKFIKQLINSKILNFNQDQQQHFKLYNELNFDHHQPTRFNKFLIKFKLKHFIMNRFNSFRINYLINYYQRQAQHQQQQMFDNSIHSHLPFMKFKFNPSASSSFSFYQFKFKFYFFKRNWQTVMGKKFIGWILPLRTDLDSDYLLYSYHPSDSSFDSN